MNSEYIIKCNNISKSFGGVKALDNVCCNFLNGKITGIIGGNGAGKTTLFNIITGFTTLNSGNIKVFRGNSFHNITNKKCEQLTKYGMVRTFQHIRLFNEYTVHQNILCGIYSMNKNIKDIDLWIDLLNLKNVQNSNVTALPYGTRRLVELGRCLATGSKIIFLDEIGAGMTDDELMNISNILLYLNKTFKITFIVIEHNMPFIKNVCNFVYAMDNGQILKFGDTNTVLKDKLVIERIIE